MVSDTLSDALDAINRDLQSYPESYPPGDPLTLRIIHMTHEMEAIRRILDTPLSGDEILALDAPA